MKRLADFPGGSLVYEDGEIAYDEIDTAAHRHAKAMEKHGLDFEKIRAEEERHLLVLAKIQQGWILQPQAMKAAIIDTRGD